MENSLDRMNVSLRQVENQFAELRTLVARMEESGKPPHETMEGYIISKCAELNLTIANFRNKYHKR